MKVLPIIFIFLSIKLFSNNFDSTSVNSNIDSVYIYENYETLELDSIYNLEDLDEQELFNDELMLSYSKGWFPRIIGTYSNMMIKFSGIVVMDFARDVTSDYFVPTNKPFNSSDDRSNDESEQREKYSDDEKSLSDNGSWSYGLHYSFSSILPFFTEIGISYQSLKSDIYSIDKSKQFLFNEEVRDFKEGASILVKDYGISGQINIILPLYGAFVGFEEFFSIYTLSLGYQAYYIFDSNVIQEFQILNNKDKIRYSNGTDKMRVIDNKELENTLKFRSYLELGLGFRMGSPNGFIDYSITFGIPTQSLLSDNNWKQYLLGLELKLAL